MWTVRNCTASRRSPAAAGRRPLPGGRTVAAHSGEARPSARAASRRVRDQCCLQELEDVQIVGERALAPPGGELAAQDPGLLEQRREQPGDVAARRRGALASLPRTAAGSPPAAPAAAISAQLQGEEAGQQGPSAQAGIVRAAQGRAARPGSRPPRPSRRDRPACRTRTECPARARARPMAQLSVLVKVRTKTSRGRGRRGPLPSQAAPANRRRGGAAQLARDGALQPGPGVVGVKRLALGFEAQEHHGRNGLAGGIGQRQARFRAAHRPVVGDAALRPEEAGGLVEELVRGRRRARRWRGSCDPGRGAARPGPAGRRAPGGTSRRRRRGSRRWPAWDRR